MGTEGKINLRIMNPDKILYKGEVESIFLQGDEGEFEVLPYHYPVLSLLRQGRIVIDWHDYIPIKKGIVRLFKNDCTILVDLDE